jgi:acyl-CoA oxidase
MSTRILMLANHLSTRFPGGDYDTSLDHWRKKSSHLNPKVIQEEYLGPNYPTIQKIRDFMSTLPLLNYHEDMKLSTEALQGKVLNQLFQISQAFPMDYDKEKANPNLKVTLLYTIGEYDIATSTRLVVTLSLYLDSLLSFGTEKHRKLIDDGYCLKDFGCFAMTELGHGSNVAGVETTATFLKESREFLINSPTRTSAKWWVGAAGKTANMAIVWAQMIVEGINQGVHMFVVPIRNNLNQNIDGVVLGDCGPKLGLHGIDNGFILFKNYRVGYDALLDKLSQVNSAGKFKSSVKSRDKRLGIMIGALIRGRNSVIIASSLALGNALTCALRYSAVRKQFTSGGKEEVSILSYQAQKVRLIPVLANCFAIRCGNHLVQQMIAKSNQTFLEHPEGEDLAEFHAILSALKAVCSWYGIYGSQICRESCGGHGYSAFSSLGRFRNNQEVQVTWEGDNMVLFQQTSKYILKQIQKTMKGQKIFSETLRFLRMGHDESKKENIKNLNDMVSALEHVVNLYLNESMMKLQEMSGSGGTMTEIWNNSQSFYLQELAKSYAELVLVKEFGKMVEKMTERDKVTGETIGKLRDLYALTVLERYLPALIEIGYNVSHRRDFRDKIITLCEEIGEVSIGIIDSIAPPDRVLSSTLGSSDGQVYTRIIDSVEKWPDVYSPPYWLETLMNIRGISK